MSKLKGAVIGVGYLGNFHAQKIKNNPLAELVGVYDQYTPQADKIAGELQTQAFKSLQDVVNSKVDFVTIAAATQAHYDVAHFFLSHKIPVLVDQVVACNNNSMEDIKLYYNNSYAVMRRFNIVCEARIKDEYCVEVYEKLKKAGKISNVIGVSTDEKLSKGVSIINGVIYDNYFTSAKFELGYLKRLPGKIGRASCRE